MVSRDGNRPTMPERRTHDAGDLPLVIGIASSLEDRVRLAELVDGFGPLVLVSSRDEARAVLADRQHPVREAEPAEPEPAREASSSSRVTELAGIQVDSDRLRASHQTRHVGLTPLEHDLLMCLGSEPRRTWTHSALHQAVWNNGHGGGRADIHSVVKRLRRKLAEIGAPATIDAVRGVGFRLGETPQSVGWL